MHDLTQLRRQIRQRRREIPSDTRQQWSHEICAAMGKLDAFQTAQKVAGFLAFDGEADPYQLMLNAIDQQKQVFVPIIVKKGQPLKFSPWSPTTPMTTNRFGILEPNVDPTKWIDANKLDFVVTPLVAFSENCHRIGVGGGFYDRSFAFLNSPGSHQTTLAGFAFELQKVDTITPSSWDIQLHHVVTETHIYGG